MGKMKKAVFFSIISIFLIILFLAGSKVVTDMRIGESEIEVTRTRVRLVNSMIEDMQEIYFEKLLFISTKNAIIGLSRYYYDDYSRLKKPLRLAMDEVIYAGILNNSASQVNLSKLNYMKYDYTINGLTEKITQLYNQVGVDIKEFSVNIKSVKQVSPFVIEVEADFDYYFKDKSNIASWKGSLTKKTNVTIYSAYAFDYEDYPSSQRKNRGVITYAWRQDLGPYYTEPSFVNKMSVSYVSPSPGLGICSPTTNCYNDTG